MIGHAIYGKWFVTVFNDNSCYILIQLIFPGVTDQGNAVFYGKYDMEMYLRKSVCQGILISGKIDQEKLIIMFKST
jgi:hypothetical protein